MDIWNFIQYICGQVGKYCKESDSGTGAMTQRQRALAVLLAVPRFNSQYSQGSTQRCHNEDNYFVY